MTAHIASIGLAVPKFSATQLQASTWFENNYRDSVSRRSIAFITRLLRHPSISNRHFAIEEADALLNENRNDRIERFTAQAVNLAEEAVRSAVGRTDIRYEEINGILVNTCTGYLCPGLSTYLLERLNLSPQVKCFDLVGSGCGGSLPNLQLCSAMAEQTKGIYLLVSVEICSATFQIGDSPSLLVSNAIFSDGAAAAVICDRKVGVKVLAGESRMYPEFREDVRYVHVNGDLHNQLSSDLPTKVGSIASYFVTEFLDKMGLCKDEITDWVIHPGGQRIIDEIKKQLDLKEEFLESSRNVLRKYGNMSSPTLWFVLSDCLGDNPPPNKLILMLGFGAGMSAYISLLKT